MQITRKQKRTEGFVLLVAVMISTIILAITMGVLDISSSEILFSSSAVRTGEAQLAADAGIECALYNDKNSINKFPLTGPATSINCLNTAITPSFTGTANSASYDFVISGMGSSGQACAIINVFKDNSVVPMETTVTSRGYNVGNSSCVSTNPNRVEREFIATTGDISALGGGGGGGGPTTYSLSISKLGTGTGTVTSSPGSINCGSVCADSFSDGTVVTLSHSAGSGSTFAGWSGDSDCSDGSVTMNLNVACIATFNLSSTFPTIASSNSSSQLSDTTTHTVNLPSGISVGDLLLATVAFDGNNPSPAPSVTWPGSWTKLSTNIGTDSGDLFEVGYKVATISDVGLGSITLTSSNSQRSVHRSFRITGYVSVPQIAVNSTSLSGTTPNPPNLSPTWGSQPTLWFAVAALGPGTNVSVSGYPGSPFPGTGSIIQSGTDFNGASIVISTANSQVASVDPTNFTVNLNIGWVGATIGVQGGVSAPTNYTLDVTKSGTGTGTVTATVGAINCGATCTDPNLASGTTLSLNQSAGPSSSFSGWSGDCTGTGACNLTMNSNRSVVATFTSSNHTLSIAKNGLGTVTANTGAINCGAICSDSYANNTNIILSATPSSGYNFSGWSGGSCSGTGNCTFNITSTHTVTATFTPQPIALDSVSDSLIRTSTTSPNNTPPITWSHTVGSGNNRILVVTTSHRSTVPVNSVTYGGAPLTQIRSDVNSPSYTSIWYLVNPPVGTASVSVSGTATLNHFQGNGVSLFNVNQSSPVDAHNGANALSIGPVSVSLITNTANTWIVNVAALRTDASETLTMSALTNRVERENSLTSAGGLRTGVSTVGPAAAVGSYLLNWSTSYTSGCTLCVWATSAAAFKQ